MAAPQYTSVVGERRTNSKTKKPYVRYAQGNNWIHVYDDGRRVVVPRQAAPQPGAPNAAPSAAPHPVHADNQAAAIATQVAAAPKPPPPPPDPRDSFYTTGVTNLIARLAQQAADTRLAQERDDVDLATIMRRMAAQRGDDLKATDSASNREGLFYSTLLRDRRGKVENEHAERESDTRTAAQRREEDRKAALAAAGEITADGSSPMGYSGKGAAGEALLELFKDAISRARENL